MKLQEAEALAKKLIGTYLDDEWTFAFDNAKSRLGLCSYRRKQISISRVLTELNSDSEVRDTILHEIAHAQVGGRAGHNFIWKQQARSIGCTGRTTSFDAISAPKTFVSTCPNCKHESGANRRGRRACGSCCRKYNYGRFSTDYLLEWRRA